MSYQLKQTPVPIWAMSHQAPISVDAEMLPAYFYESGNKNTANPQKDAPARPQFLEQRGRWNSVINPYSDPNHTTVDPNKGDDPSLLDHYELDSKWENHLAKEEEETYTARLDKFQEKVLKYLRGSPFIPIALRGSAGAYVVIALALSCAVFVQTKKSRGLDGTIMSSGFGQSSSTILSIVLCSISTAYLFYSLWDETFGQPLGLRPSHSKMKFVLIDLLLLCLMAANVAVAFDAMIFKGYICPALQNHRVCKLHKALVSFILVTLVTWFCTFLVSSFRMIDRATH